MLSELLRIVAGGKSVILRPSDLTLASYSRRHSLRVGQLPAERGIENVHAFTYAKTYASNVSAAEPPLAVEAHSCLMVIEQFWTVNYWHWTTDALPKVKCCSVLYLALLLFLILLFIWYRLKSCII